MGNTDPLDQQKKDRLSNQLSDVISTLTERDFKKALAVIKTIPKKCELDQTSKEHAVKKRNDPKQLHPTRPVRGEVYNVLILYDNVGTELIGNYLCVVISNKKKNIYSEKVNVVDRKSTRLNSSHVKISYAVFCLKKKKRKW